ncbi:hypothetical protein LguiB_034446 [Lonicera macranthoides]
MMQVSGAFCDISVVLPSTAGYRSPEFRHFHSFSDSKFLLTPPCLKEQVEFRFINELEEIKKKVKMQNKDVSGDTIM